MTGGSVTNNSYSVVGWNGGSVGTVTVSSGTWNNNGTLYAGLAGTGTLEVTGGSVTNHTGFLGVNGGSVGTATVSSGSWANSGDLTVGVAGNGTLTVSGGTVSNVAGHLGYDAGGVGTATVSGGTWANSGLLNVGRFGTGSLTVSGGTVTNGEGFVGRDVGGNGSATVSSGTWANSSLLAVGSAGTGTLDVTGGSVTNTNGFVGWGGSGVGTVTVSSGTWANSGLLALGANGSGTLNVTGGSVTNSNAFLGWGGSGVGTATVTSGTWANSGDLNVGVNGTGTLTIDGGLVSVGGMLSQGSAGTINLNAGGTLQIGTGGTVGGLAVSTLVNNGTLVFNRSDDSAYYGVVSGSGAVVKQGAGALYLRGNNTYSGATTIAAGTLVINGSLANTAVTIGLGGTLDGSGWIGGLVTVQSGGVLSPGNSPGLLSVGTLDLLAGSTSLMQIVGDGSGGAGTAGTGYDSLTIATSSGLSYGGSLDLEFSNGMAFLDDTFFEIFAFSGFSNGQFDSVFASGTGIYAGANFSGTGGIWTSLIGEQRLTFSELTGRLTFTAVPEIDPATGGSVLSLVTGMLAILEQRRRRRTSPRA